MPLSLDTFLCSTRISSAGELLGTGFLVGAPSERHEDVHWPFWVTAHHVIRNQVEVSVEITDAFTGELHPPMPVTDWWQPFQNVDLALAPLRETRDAQVRSVPMDRSAMPPGSTPAPGVLIYYIGIFQPADVPMVRSGVFGAPKVPIKKKQSGYDYWGCLVDCRSYNGFSGSPCFMEAQYPILNSDVQPEGGYVDPDANRDVTGGEKARYGAVMNMTPLVGMFVAHYDDEGEETNPEKTVSRFGVGVMLPATYIWEALATEPVRRHMKHSDDLLSEEQTAKHPEPKDAGAKKPSANEAYERFEDLTRKLVQTPKPADD